MPEEKEVAAAGLLEAISAQLRELANHPEWQEEKDDLGVQVAGMVLYGLAYACGRTIFLMDEEEIDEQVFQALQEELGVAARWSAGLVEEASLTIFDRSRHHINHDLIAAGHDASLKNQPIAELILECIRRIRPEVVWPSE